MLAAQKVLAMLGNETLWNVAVQCHELFQRAGISYSICGGLAVCIHGYQRNTTDVDMIVRPDDSALIKAILLEAGFTWDEPKREFVGASGISLHFVLSGQRAGKGSEVTIQEPVGDLNVELRDGVQVVKLSRLIEMKIACGTGSLRRTHKDFADVVELIAVRNLDNSFAQYLHKSLRDTFKELVQSARAT